MTDSLLTKIFSEFELECPICWDRINTSKVVCTVCCGSIYHRDCYMTEECQVCEHPLPEKVKCSSRIIQILISKNSVNVNELITAIAQYDINLARKTDDEYRQTVSMDTYTTSLGGVYSIPINCAFDDTSNSKSLYKKGDNVFCSITEFHRRWDEFSHGLFTNFKWPKNCYLSGMTIPALLGRNNYNYAYQSNIPIHFIVFDTSYEKTEQVKNQIEDQIKSSLVGIDTEIKYATHNKYIYLKVTGITRLIRIEFFSSIKFSLYEILKNYSLSNYEMCQTIFDGRKIRMTTKAMVAFANQKTVRKPTKVPIYHYHDATSIHFSITGAKSGVYTQAKLPQVFDDKINRGEQITCVKQLGPTLQVTYNSKTAVKHHLTQWCMNLASKYNMNIKMVAASNSNKKYFDVRIKDNGIVRIFDDVCTLFNLDRFAGYYMKERNEIVN